MYETEQERNNRLVAEMYARFSPRRRGEPPPVRVVDADPFPTRSLAPPAMGTCWMCKEERMLKFPRAKCHACYVNGGPSKKATCPGCSQLRVIPFGAETCKACEVAETEARDRASFEYQMAAEVRSLRDFYRRRKAMAASPPRAAPASEGTLTTTQARFLVCALLLGVSGTRWSGDGMAFRRLRREDGRLWADHTGPYYPPTVNSMFERGLWTYGVGLSREGLSVALALYRFLEVEKRAAREGVLIRCSSLSASLQLAKLGALRVDKKTGLVIVPAPAAIGSRERFFEKLTSLEVWGVVYDGGAHAVDPKTFDRPAGVRFAYDTSLKFTKVGKPWDMTAWLAEGSTFGLADAEVAPRPRLVTLAEEIELEAERARKILALTRGTTSEEDEA